MGAGASGAVAGMIAGMVPNNDIGKGGQIAAQSLFSASAAANAIPVAGQFASAALAIAGMFTKIFAGKRKAKKREGQEAEARKQSKAQEAVQPTSEGVSGTGLPQTADSQITTTPAVTPETPAFSSYGGGPAPSVQQQTISKAIGFK